MSEGAGMDGVSGSPGSAYRSSAPDPVLYRWVPPDRSPYHVGLVAPFVALLVLGFVLAAFSGDLVAIACATVLLWALLRIVRPSVRDFEHEVLLRERSISWGRADRRAAQSTVHRSDVAKVLMDRGGPGSASRLIIVDAQGQLAELPYWTGSEAVLDALRQHWPEVEIVRPEGAPPLDSDNELTDEDG